MLKALFPILLMPAMFGCGDKVDDEDDDGATVDDQGDDTGDDGSDGGEPFAFEEGNYAIDSVETLSNGCDLALDDPELWGYFVLAVSNSGDGMGLTAPLAGLTDESWTCAQSGADFDCGDFAEVDKDGSPRVMTTWAISGTWDDVDRMTAAWTFDQECVDDEDICAEEEPRLPCTSTFQVVLSTGAR